MRCLKGSHWPADAKNGHHGEVLRRPQRKSQKALRMVSVLAPMRELSHGCHSPSGACSP
jgi:hypothetical protein